MSFINEIAHRIGAAVGGYELINFNGEYVYVEGIKRVAQFDGQTITLDIFGACLNIVGENLEIEELTSSSVLIKGRITATDVLARP